VASRALQRWRSTAQTSLDEIEAAHRAIGGIGPGRRYATEQLNHAYAVLLSSQFQRFCRELHTEAAFAMTASPTPNVRYDLFKLRLLEGRKLSVGNPNPGNLGSDFGRFGINFWNEVTSHDARNLDRRAKLESLNLWRNAIAHQDFDPAMLGPALTLRISTIRAWRAACDGLAISFDEVVSTHLAGIIGSRPW
jgi:hypothetical protein